MSKADARIAIELTPTRVHAVARAGGVITGWRDVPIEGDAGATLRAIAKELGTAGARAIVALARTDTVLKTIALPEGGLADHERPAFVRLQMDRQLPFPAGHAAIDFVDAPHVPPALLAAAVRDETLRRAIEAARDAGFNAPVVGLVDEGLARTLGAHAPDDDACIGVFASEERCEIVVARSGRLLMSRACELPEEQGAWREAVVTEARRTLMSYRVRPDSSALTSGALMCPPDREEELRRALEPALDMGALTALNDDAPEAPPTVCARLAGMLALGDDHLDFAHPTTAPDRMARPRQLAMLVVLVLITALGAWMTMGLREKRALEAELETARAERADATKKALRVLRTDARLDHANAWLDASPDWLAHASLVADRLPAQGEMLLDRFDLGADLELDYDTDARAYDDDGWLSSMTLGVSLVGRASTPDVARTLRASLIDLDAYTLTPIGEDAGATGEGRYPVPVGLTLATALRDPAPNDASAEGDDG